MVCVYRKKTQGDGGAPFLYFLGKRVGEGRGRIILARGETKKVSAEKERADERQETLPQSSDQDRHPRLRRGRPGAAGHQHPRHPPHRRRRGGEHRRARRRHRPHNGQVADGNRQPGRRRRRARCPGVRRRHPQGHQRRIYRRYGCGRHPQVPSKPGDYRPALRGRRRRGRPARGPRIHFDSQGDAGRVAARLYAGDDGRRPSGRRGVGRHPPPRRRTGDRPHPLDHLLCRRRGAARGRCRGAGPGRQHQENHVRPRTLRHRPPRRGTERHAPVGARRRAGRG